MFYIGQNQIEPERAKIILAGKLCLEYLWCPAMGNQSRFPPFGATGLYCYWQRKWGGDPSVIGKTIDLITSRAASWSGSGPR